MLRALNVLFGFASLALMAHGFVANDGLQGLGLALLMTALISYVGFRFAAEQREAEKKAAPPKAVASGFNIAS
jgi:hypothetical protein